MNDSSTTDSGSSTGSAGVDEPRDASTDASSSDAAAPSVFTPIGEQVEAVKRAIEAIILVAHDPVPAELLAQIVDHPASLIETWCDELAESYRSSGHGFDLVRVAGGFRYQTASDLTPYVERFLLHDQRARLSGAALETLAIVAYKQPISRAQVGAIRGVDPDGVLRTLAARGYIDEIGRDDGPGQAILFGTTDTFLEKLGLESIDDLPAIAEFIPGADVVELLEHGLRVTPEIDVAPQAVHPVGDDDQPDLDSGEQEAGQDDEADDDDGEHEARTGPAEPEPSEPEPIEADAAESSAPDDASADASTEPDRDV